MNRIHKLLSQRNVNDKILSVFITAGFPERDCTPELAVALEEAGVDFVELGVPFSDPIADGPTIQQSSFRALQNGVTLGLVLEQVRSIRKQSDLPIVLMGYFNPLLRFGLDRLVREAQEAGVDGFIIPDLLPDDYDRFRSAFEGQAAGVNFLVSPNTRPERVRLVDERTDAFIYCVSVTGVTGARSGVPAGILEYLDTLKTQVRHPVFVGFGISSGEDAATIAEHCDGVIVGSAVIKRLAAEGPYRARLASATEFVRELSNSLKGA